MFERRDLPLISTRRFTIRVMKAVLIVLAIDGLAVLLGAIGYREFAGLDWLAACSNAIMVITGNGLVTPVSTESGRIFSMFDALFGVLVFVTAAGMVLAPVFHRILHSFHLEAPTRNR
jgi:hypothetical protein